MKMDNINMIKNKYKITPRYLSDGTPSYKTQMWDEYGAECCVYNRSKIAAMEYVLEWSKESKERKELNDSLSDCLSEMYKNRENGK